MAMTISIFLLRARCVESEAISVGMHGQRIEIFVSASCFLRDASRGRRELYSVRSGLCECDVTAQASTRQGWWVAVRRGRECRCRYCR